MNSLPMYDLIEIRGETDRLWAAIAARLRSNGIDAPLALQQPEALDAHWRQPSLLLSQSCGYPLLSLPAHVRVVATPCYRAEGCDGASYRSALLVREADPAGSLADLRGGCCAINDWDSNSGMNLLRASVAPLAQGGPFFDRVVRSGSHAASLALVRNGQADLAAIDCVTLALLARYRPDSLVGLRILDWTMASPGLPLITAGDQDMVNRLRRVLHDVETDPALRPVLDALLIVRFAVLPWGAYDAVDALERDAMAAGYPVLR